MFKRFLFFSSFFVLILFFTNAPSIAQKSMARPTVWDVYPTMNLSEIQAVVDSASNGDTISFHAGTYDWSGALTPIYDNYANEGAIKIIDKTLTIKGARGNLIRGPDTTWDYNTTWGSNAFYIQDEDTNNDVTFNGLNIEHFMRGIAAFSYNLSPHTANHNTRNVTVKNCSISDIARYSITVICSMGDILIESNTVSQCTLGAISISYLDHPTDLWQPDDSKVNIRRNTITGCPWMGMHVEMTKNFRIENNSIALSSPSEFTGHITGPGSGIYILGAQRGTVFSSNSISNYPIGISVDGKGAWGSPPALPAENILIKRNKVSCLFYNECYGISLAYDDSSGHTVTGNEINLTSEGAVGIYSETNNNFFGKNKISGSGRIGFWLSGRTLNDIYPAYAHNESLNNNNLCGFTASEAHYYLDSVTYDNSIIGSDMCPWTYKDYGTNNTIIGGTNITSMTVQTLNPIPQKSGQDFREARKRIRF